MSFYKTHLLGDWATIRGPARLLIAPETVDHPQFISDVMDESDYDAVGEWTDLGATKGGARINYGFGNRVFGLNQSTGQIEASSPTAQLSISTQLAENTYESYRAAWATTESDLTEGDEETFGVGIPGNLTYNRICLAYQDNGSGLIRLYCVHRAIIVPSGDIAFNKSGDQVTLPIEIVAAQDASIADIRARFMKIIQPTFSDLIIL